MTATANTRLTLLLPGKILGLALVCGVLLSTVHALSRDTIADNQQAFEMQQLEAVVGNPDIELVAEGDNYRLTKNGSDFGTLKSVVTFEGYNGKIRFWLATQNNGKVLGLRVIEHQETPGLGDKLELAVSDWVLGFNDTSLQTQTWDVKKFGGDFDQFSGATITPRAVILAVKEALISQQQTQKSNQTHQTNQKSKGETP